MKRRSCFFPVGKWFFISSLLAWVCLYLNKSSVPSFCVGGNGALGTLATGISGRSEAVSLLWRLGVRDSSSWLVCEVLPSMESLGCVAPQRAQCNSHFAPPGEVASFPGEPVCVFVRVRTRVALFVCLSDSQRTVG